jgi:drug/metabolite transporter (DMT)-like permease
MRWCASSTAHPDPERRLTAAHKGSVEAGSGPVAGAACVFGAYFLYAAGDAAAKWLVGSLSGSLSVWEVLSIRSWLGLLMCLVLGGRAALDALIRVPGRRGLLGMNLANFAGWVAYYSAAVNLPLPQLYAIYYLSPIIAALLAGPMLGERIRPVSWIAAALGFTGVVITTSPLHAPLPALAPALLAVAAAVAWAVAAVLYRRNVHGRSNLELLIYSNVAIGVASSAPLAWHWQGIEPRQALVLLIVAGAGLAAHFLYISGIRRVTVAVAGPIGFFSLIWSALLAYLIWGERPQPGLLAGASLIVVAALLVFGGSTQTSGSPDPDRPRQPPPR